MTEEVVQAEATARPWARRRSGRAARARGVAGAGPRQVGGPLRRALRGSARLLGVGYEPASACSPASSPRRTAVHPGSDRRSGGAALSAHASCSSGSSKGSASAASSTCTPRRRTSPRRTLLRSGGNLGLLIGNTGRRSMPSSTSSPRCPARVPRRAQADRRRRVRLPRAPRGDAGLDRPAERRTGQFKKPPRGRPGR